MAEYGIVVGFKDIKGNCALADFKDYVLATNVNFGSASTRAHKADVTKRVSVEQSPLTITIVNGKWVAELQNACYISKNLGEVKLVQTAQAIDKEAQAKPTVVQTVTLQDAVIVGIDQSWSAGDAPRLVTLTLMFSKILLEIDKKPADFVLRNFTANAV